MSKSKYKALLYFQGHKPGEQFDAELDETAERRAIDRGQIKPVATPKKKERDDA